MTVMPTPDFGPQEGPGPDTPPLAPQASAFRPPTSKPDRAAADPDVAATVRLLRRCHRWNWEALPASWRSFWPTVPVLMRSRRGLRSVVVPGHDHRAGVLTAVSIIAALVDTSLLRRKPPRSGRGPLLLPERPACPPLPARHLVTWFLRWVGMLLILVVAVVSVPAVDGKNGHLRPGFVSDQL